MGEYLAELIIIIEHYNTSNKTKLKIYNYDFCTNSPVDFWYPT